ncbi:class I SAM-dependent methyltransferase [Brevundimonas sp. NPDC092305]|uniref:class I SAM-dependent methyltransferase n=1 Tax=Brevundimonas sp. NPDC092305 TaxID=3363957 RepID=UPI00380E771F
MNGFDDPEAVARYTDNPPRLVPGFADLQKMTRLLLAETAPADGRILVIGAGGGLELKVFAEAEPGWRFVGVDPSAEMLKLARRTLGALADRVDWREGYISSVPEGPFDGASCLLVLHFVPAEERVVMLNEIRRRLKPGATFVVAHHSIPEGQERNLWLDRLEAFANTNGISFDKTKGGARTLGERLPILSPKAESDLLRAAGFVDPQLFYTALTYRGWVSRA